MKISLILLVFALISSSCSYSDRRPQERKIASVSVNQLLEEVVGYAESNLSEARKSELQVFQENLLKYLIEASNSEDEHKIATYHQATEYFNRVYPGIIQNIRNEKSGVNSFVEIKSAPIWSLKDEIRYLNNEASKFPKPKLEIDLIDGLKIVAPFYKTISKADANKLAKQYDKTVHHVMGQEFDLHPSYNEIDSLLKMEGSDEEKILNLVSMVESKLKRHESKIRHLGSEIAKSGQVDLKNTQVRLVVTFMDYYFEHLQQDVIKTILSELVTGGPKMTEEETMKVIFKNTGPGLGKVLQQFGKEKGIGTTFSSLLAVLESNGKKVPLHLIQDIVVKDNGGYELKNIVDKPLGTGTMAQVNRATLTENGVEKEIALRFLKPGIAGRCKEDIDILRNFVPDNEKMLLQEGVEDIKVVSTLIDSVEKFLNEELDFKIAIDNQLKAYEVYSKSVIMKTESKYSMLEMKVPKVYIPPSGTSNLHVQEFASGGVKFSELTDEAAKQVVAQEMVRMWFEEALFESGFLNADLHQGNFRVVLIEEKDKIKVLLYDFGLSTILTKEDQRAFLLLGAGAYLKSSTTITDGLMASMNSSDKNMRAKLMKDIEKEMKVDPNKLAEDWVAWCVTKNYFVSDKLGAFARGSLLLKQLPESMGQTEMFKDVVIKSASTHLVKAIADRKYDFPLKKMDLVKIAAIQAKNSCMDMIKSFLNFFH
jgi:hypothetical protein